MYLVAIPHSMPTIDTTATLGKLSFLLLFHIPQVRIPSTAQTPIQINFEKKNKMKSSNPENTNAFRIN